MDLPAMTLSRAMTAGLTEERWYLTDLPSHTLNRFLKQRSQNIDLTQAFAGIAALAMRLITFAWRFNSSSGIVS
jgi:hypothetical protein